jgi:DNA-binding transcriptional MerR regulator
MATARVRLLHAADFAKQVGLTVRTLHHWERLGLLKAQRSHAGYRLYGERELARVQQIAALKFVGIPLKQIKTVLSAGPLTLAATLRFQREAIGHKQQQLQRALAAIDHAERLLKLTQGIDWRAFKRIIEVIQMSSDMEWAKKYYTSEQLADLAKRSNPEVIERGSREWGQLLHDVEAAIANGVDPASKPAQALADRWAKLIADFTGGDPSIANGLRNLYKDQANWPESFKQQMKDWAAQQGLKTDTKSTQPYSRAAFEFIKKVNAARVK